MRIDQFISGEVVDRLGDVLLLVGLDGSILDANPMALHCYGYSHTEMLSLSIRDIRAPQDQDRVEHQMREAAEHGVLFEAIHRRSDGALFPVEVRSASVGVDGETALLSIVRDITERKQAEEELRESKELYRSILNAFPDGIARTDLESRILMVSHAALTIFGYEREEGLLGHSIIDFIVPEDRGRAASNIALMFQGTLPGPGAYRALRADGSTFDIEAGHGFIRDTEGQPTNVVFIFRDITERKQADEELRESERRFRTVFDLLPGGVAALDADGVVAFANPALERMLGISQERLRQGVSASRTYIRGDGTPMPREEFPSFITKREGRAVYGVETGIVKEDGSVLWVSVSASPVALTDWRAIVVMTDITKRKAAEEELAAYHQSLEALVETRTADLEAANRQLREATTAKSEFLANMSHELRTPLNSVIGFSSILSQGLAGPLTDEQHTQLRMINVSGRHLLSLVDDILDLAKIEAGRAEVHVEPVDVAALVQAVASAIGPLAQEEGLELRAETDGCSMTLHSDSGKIRQILFNLIGNAVKFTEHGSVVVTVQDEPDGAFSFAVSDTGLGIAQEDMTRIFAAFTQVPVSASGKPKGTGLGLRISREYAHMLGGEITVRSEVGVGSTFTLTLPAEPPSPVSPDAVGPG